MFRTDSALKGVSRRAPAPRKNPGTSGGSGSSSSTSGPGPTSGAGAGRDAAVEQARVEREEREWARKASAHAVVMQARSRRGISKRHTEADVRAGLLEKLDDVAKVHSQSQIA